jgi:hypothetical protein
MNMSSIALPLEQADACAALLRRQFVFSERKKIAGVVVCGATVSVINFHLQIVDNINDINDIEAHAVAQFCKRAAPEWGRVKRGQG